MTCAQAGEPPRPDGTDIGAMTSARLTPFVRGQICAWREAGWTRPQIAARVRKTDNTPCNVATVDKVLKRKAEDTQWDGELDSSERGRPQALSEAQKKELRDFVFAQRGQVKVTVPYCRKCLPFLRRVSKDTARRALHEVGLAWLRRRKGVYRREVS